MSDPGLQFRYACICLSLWGLDPDPKASPADCLPAWPTLSSIYLTYFVGCLASMFPVMLARKQCWLCCAGAGRPLHPCRP